MKLHHSPRAFLFLLALLLPAAGGRCAEPQPAAAPPASAGAAGPAPTVSPGDTLAVSYHIAIADDTTSYSVDSGDELYLNFRYSPELSQIYIKQLDLKDQREEKWDDKVSILSRAYLVQPDGTLMLTGLSQPLRVKGLTTLQIARQISTLYGRSGLLSHPDVNVTVDPKYKRYEAFQKSIQSANERPLFRIPVPADGRISLPLVTGVPAGGRTVEEIGRDLTERYHKLHLELVTVTTWLDQLGGQGRDRVRVYGEVKSQGFYLVSGTLDLWDAIWKAGGFTTDADVNGVRVVDQGGKGALGTFRFDEYLNSGDPRTNLTLHGGELIYVPRKK